MAPIEESKMRRIEAWAFDEIRPYVDNEALVAFQLPSEALGIGRYMLRMEMAVPEHVHSVDHVVIVYDGEMAICCDGKVFPLSKGMVLRIPAATVHSAAFKAGCDFMEIGLGMEANVIGAVPPA